MIGFAFIMIYMTVSALMLTFKGLDVLIKENKGSLTLSDFKFFTNTIFRNIVLSLAAMLRDNFICETSNIYITLSTVKVSIILPVISGIDPV
jgi:hypothetical protein